MEQRNEVPLTMEVKVEENHIAECEKQGHKFREMKKTYSNVFCMLSIFLVVIQVLQYVMLAVFHYAKIEGEWTTWAMIAVPIYAIGFPLISLTLKWIPKNKLKKNSLKFTSFFAIVFINCAICAVGSVIGNLINMILTFPAGVATEDQNGLVNLMMDSTLWMRALVVGILAPIFEELIFRKLLIERMIRYGEWTAILVSGLAFGMFHGNFSQFFFATGLGITFGYVFVRTGKVRYSIMMHMVVNLSSSVITMLLIEYAGLGELLSTPGLTPDIIQMIPLIIWYGILGLSALAGILFTIFGFLKKKFYILKIKDELPYKRQYKAAFANIGFIIYSVLILIMFVLYYAQFYIA